MQDLDELYRAAIRLHQQGNAPAAAKAYETILNARPDHAGALHLKGVLALQAADYDDAIALIQRSLHLMPKHALAWSNLSVALRAKNQLTEAIAALERALAIGPETAEAWGNLTRTQMEAGFIPQSVASAYKAIRLRGDDLGARQFAIFGSNYLGETDPLTLKDEARQFGLIAERLVPQRNHHDNDRNPDRVIRVGLVCADMRAHAVGRFLISFLDQLDPQKIELIAYSESTKPDDDLTARFKAAIPAWRATAQLDHATFCAQVVSDKIDVLVDLVGQTGPRIAAFAGKPAPVAFTWLAYFATTGISQIDYVLANRWVLPEAEEAQWIEKPWRLPDTYLCFDKPEGAGEVRPLPALQSRQVTFGSFNNFNKLSDATLRAWSGVLNAVQGSRLILRSSGSYQEGVVEELTRRLSTAGIDPSRVRIDPYVRDYAAHLTSYAEIDIALDPFPYNGGTTTVEALYMGVPVLVRAGDRYVAHMGESVLHNVGLADWIASDADTYPRLAACMASDLSALAALRAGLRARMLASPLFDAPRFARNFEDAIRGMWQSWCEGNRQ